MALPGWISAILGLLPRLVDLIAGMLHRRETAARDDRRSDIRDDPGSEWMRRFGPGGGAGGKADTPAPTDAGDADRDP